MKTIFIATIQSFFIFSKGVLKQYDNIEELRILDRLNFHPSNRINPYIVRLIDINEENNFYVMNICRVSIISFDLYLVYEK